MVLSLCYYEIGSTVCLGSGMTRGEPRKFCGIIQRFRMLWKRQKVMRNVRALSGLPRKKKCGGAQIVWSGQFR